MPKSLSLFGSVARGDDTDLSDGVDLVNQEAEPGRHPPLQLLESVELGLRVRAVGEPV